MKSEEIKKVIQKKINITNLKIGINKFKKIGDNNIIISCSRKPDTEKLMKKVNSELGEILKAKEKKKIILST
jgi:hypothetical protein